MKKKITLLVFCALLSTLGYSAPFCDAGLFNICGAARLGVVNNTNGDINNANGYVKIWGCVSSSSIIDERGQHTKVELKKLLVGNTTYNLNTLKEDKLLNGYVLNINNKKIRFHIENDGTFLFLQVSKVVNATTTDLTDLAVISYRYSMKDMLDGKAEYCLDNFPMVNNLSDCPGYNCKNCNDSGDCKKCLEQKSSTCATCKLAVTSLAGVITNVEEISTDKAGKETITALTCADHSAIGAWLQTLLVTGGSCAGNYDIISVETQFKGSAMPRLSY